MSVSSAAISQVRWTARELRKLPAHERDRILEAAAKAAEGEYRTNGDLTGFEAFGVKADGIREQTQIQRQNSDTI